MAELLQKKIAEMLGWQEVEMYSYWAEDFYANGEIHCLFGTDPDGERRPLPQWTTDIHEAWSLPLDRPFYWQVTGAVGGTVAAAILGGEKGWVKAGSAGTIADIARLMVKAWEEWKESQ